MALKEAIIQSLEFSICCNNCTNRDVAYGGTRNNAAKEFKAAGWIETETEILCPRCSKERQG